MIATTPTVVIRSTAVVDVTPADAHPLGGFAVPRRIATGVHAPLQANLLHLGEAGGRSVVWVALDVLAIDERMRATIAGVVEDATGAAADDVVVVASHTHSAPSTWHGTIHPILPAVFDQREADRVAQRIGDAVERPAQPVSMAYGSAPVYDVGSNRHSLSGVHDDDVHTVTFRDSGGKIRAVLFEYACHPTALGPSSTMYSPDWVHAARAGIRVGLDLDSTTPVLYLPGSGGDASTRFYRRERTTGEADRLGGLLASSALEAVRADRDAPLESGISVRSESFTASVRVASSVAAAEPPGGAGSSRLEDSIREGDASLRALAHAAHPEKVVIRSSTVQVGDRAWLHHPFELAAAWGEQLTAIRPHLRVIGYSDGYCGYLADSRSHDRSEYEASASYFDMSETARIIAQLEENARRSWLRPTS